MAGNKIEILVEVDPGGQGAKAIKSITANVESLGKGGKTAGDEGAKSLNGMLNTALGAATAITGVVTAAAATTKYFVDSSLNGQRAMNVLKADAQQAGLTIADAGEKAKKFGNDLQLSNTQAEKSFGQFLRVVRAAGEVNNVDKYQKNFENLAAQYSLTAGEIETLTQQLLSGQDEALNRLGIADPGALYQKYADSVGRTVQSLTDEEKVRVRLNALSEKGAQFEGAVNERINSQIGYWGQLEKSIADASQTLGDFLLKQTIIGDVPLLAQAAATGQDPFVLKQKQIADQYKAGEETARIAAQKQSDAYFKALTDGLNSKEALKNPFGSFANLVSIDGGTQATKIRDDFIKQYEALFKTKGVTDVTKIFAQDQFNNIKGIFTADKQVQIQQGLDKMFKPALDKVTGYLKKARDEAGALFGDLSSRYAGNESNPFVKILVEADSNARKLEKTFGALGEAATAEFRKIEAGYVRQQTLGAQLDNDLKAAANRREANRLANPVGLNAAQERELSTFDAKITAATNTATLKATAAAIRSGAVGNRQINAKEFFETQYANRLGVLPNDLTDSQKFLATRGKDSQIEQLDKRMQFFVDSGLNLNSGKLFDETFGSLRRLIGESGQGGDVGRRETSAVSDALANYFNGLDKEQQARIATGGEGKDTQNIFANAFDNQAKELQNKIGDEIAKGRVSDEAIKGLRSDIAEITKARAAGLDSRGADARLLSVTGAIPINEQPADIIQARIEALRREADRTANEQKDAIDATNKARESTDNLIKSIDTLATQIKDPKQRRLLIQIANATTANVRDELYGSTGEDEQ